MASLRCPGDGYKRPAPVRRSYSKSPSKVNFVLIDVGATSLMPFEGLPHLSCPVVRERTAAAQTLAALTTEMERRIELEYADHASFKRLPRLVVVIDEFPALFMGVEKSMVRGNVDALHSLRGIKLRGAQE